MDDWMKFSSNTSRPVKIFFYYESDTDSKSLLLLLFLFLFNSGGVESFSGHAPDEFLFDTP